MLPISAIASALGCDVRWDVSSQTTVIGTKNARITPPVGWVAEIEKHYAMYAPDQLAARQSWLEEEAENQRILSGKTIQRAESTGDNTQKEPKKEIEQGKRKYTVFSPMYNKTFEYTFNNPSLPAIAPVVGTVPAKILIDESVPYAAYPDPQNPSGAWIQNRTKEYAGWGSSLVGGCNWYAKARYWEINGVPMTLFDNFLGAENYLDFADQYDEFLAIRDIYDVRDFSVVVYGKGSYNSGHVAFVEYVERDLNGKPVNIYFTEANADNTTGDYRHGIDGAVHKLNVSDFLNRAKPTLGYIVPNPEFYK